jgi:uncharacterized protein (TIGR03000 family)
MPGWDWQRIYPWSPYNYGRIPYNPAVVPVPVPYYAYEPYPYLYPPVAPTVTYSGYAGLPNNTLIPNSIAGQMQVPQPTGEYTTPPADAAQVIVQVPDPNAQVLFDDHRTYSQGSTTRYYVTPSIPSYKTHKYTVTAIWNQPNGQNVTEKREIQVAPGHTTMIDFTRPAG